MICLTKKENAVSESPALAEVLMDYGAGTLAPETIAALDAHAGDCSACRQLLTAQKQVWQSLDLFTAPQVSGNFDQRQYARIAGIARDAQAPAVRGWVSRWLWSTFSGQLFTRPVFAGAAACAALVIGLLVFAPGKGIGVVPDQNQQTRVEKIDIDQVEQALEDLDLLAPQPAASPM